MHHKHSFIQKPAGGKFHRTEVAVLGAPCSMIQSFCQELALALQGQFQLGFVDAAHHAQGTPPIYSVQYTDRIDYHQLEFPHDDLSYQFRALFDRVDGVLVNGNHFKAEKQIVFINSKKRESLQRKLDRLTDVLLFVLDEGMEDIHPFLKEAFPNYQQIPTFSIQQKESITTLIRGFFAPRVPPIMGLVFGGGKSSRMGQDKRKIQYHGKPQIEYIADLLAPHCDTVFLSQRSLDHSASYSFPVIHDLFLELGPLGGLLSAFRLHPDVAWLAVACDLPLLTSKAVKMLIDKRDTSMLATSFHNPDTDFPEPMVTIWEPRAYRQLLNFMALGYSCLRKALINSPVNVITPPNAQILTNANTPEERDRILNQIRE